MNNKKLFLGIASFLTMAGLSISPTKAQPARSCQQELAQNIEKIVNRPQFKRSHWGITIQDLDTQENIYQLNAQKFFVPASTIKLLTTAAALDTLGKDFRIETSIYATGELPRLETLRIAGKGDPTITTENLANLAQQLKTLGVTSVDRLIIDDSYFANPLINPTWEWGDSYYYYGTTVNSIILNQNTARLTLLPQQIGKPVKLRWSDENAARQWQVSNQAITGSIGSEYTVEIDGISGKPALNIRGELPQNETQDTWDLAIFDPAQYFLTTLRELLTKSGISVNQTTIVTTPNPKPTERIITQIYSPPLAELIKEINQDSNNLYAEIILKTLAKHLSSDDGVTALETSLESLGIKTDDYDLVDGSGLSRHNLISPATLNQLLRIMSQHAESNLFQESLARAGVSGTLKRRLRQTEIAGNLWGKTGSLSGTITLSGYLQLPNSTQINLTILVNNFDDKNYIVRQAIDEIMLLIPKWKQCGIRSKNPS